MPTQTDAALLYAIVISMTAFVVAWLRTVTWPEWVKFLAAVAFSGIAGALKAYSDGTLTPEATTLSNLATIYITGRLFYFAVFQVLGLERFLLPKAALVTDARSQVSAQISLMSSGEAEDIVNTSTPSTLVVNTSIGH